MCFQLHSFRKNRVSEYIYWRLGIQQSSRSEFGELVAKPADVCLCHNLVHLLTLLGFKSSEMLTDVVFSPSAT